MNDNENQHLSQVIHSIDIRHMPFTRSILSTNVLLSSDDEEEKNGILSAKQNQETLSEQQFQLLDTMSREPEHKRYHENLHIRRLLSSQNESRRHQQTPNENILLEKPKEHTDGWQYELKVRNELADKAIEYGIEQRKLRLQNPDPHRPLALSERIKRDAEAILQKRRENTSSQQADDNDRHFTIDFLNGRQQFGHGYNNNVNKRKRTRRKPHQERILRKLLKLDNKPEKYTSNHLK